MYNILVNWMELRTYFQCAAIQGSQDVKYKARILQEMLSDDCNYLYFVFSSPIVTEFERVNSLFQSTDANPSRLLLELDMHFKTLTQRVSDRDGKLLPLEKVDFGAKFKLECKRLLCEKTLIADHLLGVQERCRNMLAELVDQVKMRLPGSRNLCDGLRKLSPSIILTHVNRPAFTDLPFFHLLENKLEQYEEQYRIILYHPWPEEFFTTGFPDDPVQFWSTVKKQEVGFQQTI